MQALANYLIKKKEPILEEWKKGVQKKNGQGERGVSHLLNLSRKEFYDHIPLFLDFLIEKFRSGKEAGKNIGRQHSLQRWKQGADIEEIIYEWGVLHQILARKINQSEKDSLIGTDILTNAQQLLTEIIHNEIDMGIDQYLSLQRQKAGIRMDDLEAALKEQESFSEQRGSHLQQTSHDLRGNMFAILMGFRLLKKEELSDEVARRIEQMSEATQNIYELLNRLLDLSRLEAGKEERDISRFDAAKVLSDVSNDLQPVAESRQLELRTKGEDSLQVQGDRLKVKRIVQNLLLNALENTKSGFVELSWEAEPPDRWQLCVRDTGPGLTAPQEPLFSNTGSDSGEAKLKHEGIGLLIVHQLCKLLDAIIKVETETETETGTLFRVTLPADYS